MKRERDKPYSFVAPLTGNLYMVVKRKGRYHLKVQDSGNGKYVKGETGIMTIIGFVALKDANAHAKMVEQMFLAERKGGKNG